MEAPSRPWSRTWSLRGRGMSQTSSGDASSGLPVGCSTAHRDSTRWDAVRANSAGGVVRRLGRRRWRPASCHRPRVKRARDESHVSDLRAAFARHSCRRERGAALRARSHETVTEGPASRTGERTGREGSGRGPRRPGIAPPAALASTNEPTRPAKHRAPGRVRQGKRSPGELRHPAGTARRARRRPPSSTRQRIACKSDESRQRGPHHRP